MPRNIVTSATEIIATFGSVSQPIGLKPKYCTKKFKSPYGAYSHLKAIAIITVETITGR